MTRITYARLAGFMFLFYIASGIAAMTLFDQATGAEGTAGKLASIAGHAPQMRLAALLSLLTIFDALVLAVALYAITRHQEPDLAVLALACRLGEGVLNAIPTLATVGLLWIATESAGKAVLDGATATALGALLLKLMTWSTNVGATLFAFGSTLYAYLFLRARSIPAPLAWLGVLASVLLVLALPLELTGVTGGRAAWSMWMPMLAFEVTLGLWLLIKGVANPPKRDATAVGPARGS